MSFIQKILAVECLESSADVRFVVIFSCVTDADVRRCKAVFVAQRGETHSEKSGAGFLFLFMGVVGANADSYLALITDLLDENQDGIDVVETKNINLTVSSTANHSFIFSQDERPDDRTIILSPSHAFGSGDHPSTGLAIEFLEECAPLQCNVLDVGCGTGVLSFVALRLLATEVYGVDIDAEGIRGAKVNAHLNNFSQNVHFDTIPLAEIPQSYPLILANLTYSVLKYLLKDISNCATTDARLIVSGLQGRQGDDAVDYVGQYGWHVSSRRSSGKWQAFLAKKA